MSERISIDGEPLDRRGVRPRLQRRGAVHPPRRRRAGPPAVVLRDHRRRWPTPRSPTPRSTSPWSRSAWAASWDATNVADADVAVVLPVARRPRPATSATARRRSPSRRPGSSRPAPSRCWPSRRPRSPRCCCSARSRGRCDRRPRGHRVRRRRRGCPPSAARWCRCRACAARYDERLPPAVRRPPGAERRRRAGRGRGLRRRRAARRRPGARAPSPRSTSPGRLEIIRRSPTIVLDAAHNPHGARGGRRRARGLLLVRPARRRHGRDGRQGPRGPARGVRAATWPTSSAPRTPPTARCPPRSWPRPRVEIFGEDRVTVAPRLADAIDQAAALAEAGEAGVALGSGAVLVTGSVVTVGEARPHAERAAE